ncbi:MAG: hypothetical protein HQL35_11760 [Alphaproteobacteria bacterium]|nr:hypothetical protein [Alphaproteobacteria bacterium]
MKNCIAGFFTGKRLVGAGLRRFTHPALEVVVRGPRLERACTAMIDTGADLCRVDEALADALDMPRAGSVPSLLVTVPMDIETRRGAIVVPGENFALHGEFPVQPFRAADCPYDVLLGMDFIRHFELTVDAAKGRVTLAPR